MAIIVFLLAGYLLGCMMYAIGWIIWSIIHGIVKLILMILGELFEIEIKQAKKLWKRND